MNEILVGSVTNLIIWSMVLVGDHRVWEQKSGWLCSLKEMGGTPPATTFSFREGGIIETCLNLQGLKLSRISELYCFVKHRSPKPYISFILRQT